MTNWKRELERILKNPATWTSTSKVAGVTEEVYKVIHEDPTFKLDKESMLSLFYLGFDYDKLPATAESIGFLNAPYRNFTIQFDHFDTSYLIYAVYDKELSDNKICLAIYHRIDPMNPALQSYLVPYCVIFDKDNILGEVVHDNSLICWHGPEVRKKLEVPENQEILQSLNTINWCVFVGLCVALNTKGFIEVKDVSKNMGFKKNALGKKEPISKHDHKFVTLSLKGREYYEQIKHECISDTIRSRSRAHLRRGHFKQRKTGMFWWNPHMACRDAEYSITKEYKVIA